MEPSWQYVGVDVSKDTLDVAVHASKQPPHTKVPHTKKGFEAALAWMRERASEPLFVCLEATGTYHDAFVAFLLEQQIPVAVLPSNRLKAFRESEGVRNKTDKLDAILLARYASIKKPPLFVPPSEELAQMSGMLGRLTELEKMHQQEKNRKGNARLDKASHKELDAHIKQLSDSIRSLLKRLRDWIKEHKELKAAVVLLRSIKGIGERTSWWLLVVLGPDASRFPSARHLVMYAGLDVTRRDSGKRKAGQISKRGPSGLRGCLGMAAIVAKRWDSDMQIWATQLQARGKKGGQVRVAMMRKLLHLAYGVLKAQTPYDRGRAWPTHAASAQPVA